MVPVPLPVAVLDLAGGVWHGPRQIYTCGRVCAFLLVEGLTVPGVGVRGFNKSWCCGVTHPGGGGR